MWSQVGGAIVSLEQGGHKRSTVFANVGIHNVPFIVLDK